MRIHQRSFTATLAGITVMAVLALPLQAQETTSSGTLNLAQRYPVGSIKSVKNANQALKDVKRQRNFIQKRYKKKNAPATTNTSSPTTAARKHASVIAPPCTKPTGYA